MSWTAIRASARRVVHDTFAREAMYTAPTVGSTPIEARIRLHTKYLRFGDLDREGFAQVIDDVNQIMVDTGEVTPEKHGIVEFGADLKFRIINVIPDKDGEFWPCEVATHDG